MLETCGPAREGMYLPGDRVESQATTGVGAPAGKVRGDGSGHKGGKDGSFPSAIVPPWYRKTPKITEVLPLLYPHGLSSGDFVPALGQSLGSTTGLTAAVITRWPRRRPSSRRPGGRVGRRELIGPVGAVPGPGGIRPAGVIRRAAVTTEQHHVAAGRVVGHRQVDR
jgi:hypothetical protein